MANQKVVISRRTRRRSPAWNEGDNSHLAKLDERSVYIIIRILAAGFMSVDEIAKVWRVHPLTIQNIRDGRSWRYMFRPVALRRNGGAQ